MNKYEVLEVLQRDIKTEVKKYFKTKETYYKNVYISQATRSKKPFSTPWSIPFVSKNNITYCLKLKIRYNPKSHNIDFNVLVRTKFRWNNRNCIAFACSSDDYNYVTVYQGHALTQYSKRVLGIDNLEDIETIFNKYIVNKGHVFDIVLPSPTHEYTHYFVIADALFLGDFYPQYEKKVLGVWLNTCISLREAHATQVGIIKTLSTMNSFVKRLEYNPLSPEIDDTAIFCKAERDKDFRNLLGEFYSKAYLLLKLHLSYNYSFTKEHFPYIDERLNYMQKRLSDLGINYKGLSPYGEKNGIAIKGEIDYKGYCS